MNDYVEMAPELLGISDKDLENMDHLDHFSAMRAIASPPPQLAAACVGRLVAEQYGLEGEFVPLISERDQNFRLKTDDGTYFVFKIANAAEDPVVTDFQIEALLHIEKIGCEIAVPQIVRTRGGATSTTAQGDDADYAARIVSYVPGHLLENIAIDTEIARQLGRCLAQLGVALHGFRHPGDSQALLWDIERASGLRDLLAHIEDRRTRTAVGQCLDDFEENLAPHFASLRSQVIHNDLNPGNVLVNDTGPTSIAGVIDFGDMIRAPLIVDVAVAASYLRSRDADAVVLLAEFVAGYDDVTRLEDTEIELLYDLVRTRLATTITIMYWRLSARAADDAYTIKSLQVEEHAGRFLARVNAVPRDEFADRMRRQCGR